MRKKGLYSEGEVVLRNRVCSELYRTSIRSKKKSKDRLVRDKNKKKAFSSTKTEEDTQQRHLGIRAQEKKSNAEKTEGRNCLQAEGKPRSRNMKIHTNNREKQVYVIGGFLLRRSN